MQVQQRNFWAKTIWQTIGYSVKKTENVSSLQSHRHNTFIVQVGSAVSELT
jgi:hypothetical protein